MTTTALSLCVSWFAVTDAHAASTARECIAAHAEGQILRNDARLLQATQKFSECAALTCPALVRQDCLAFGEQVEGAQPSVLFAAVGEHGEELRSVSVSVDHQPPAAMLDASPLALDPGLHHLRFEAPRGGVREFDVVLTEHEKNRRVVADFATEHGRRSTPRGLAYVFGGVGALALGSFGFFALSGRSIENDLERCAPSCEKSEVDRMRARYLVADVSLAVALVSLAAGTYFYLRPRALAGVEHGRRVGLAFAVTPSQGRPSGWLSASGHF